MIRTTVKLKRGLSLFLAVLLLCTGVLGTFSVHADALPQSATETVEEATPPTEDMAEEPTVEVSPEETPEITVEVTPEETPGETLEETPIVSPEEAPNITPKETPAETPEATPTETPEAVASEETPSVIAAADVPMIMGALSNNPQVGDTATGRGTIYFNGADPHASGTFTVVFTNGDFGGLTGYNFICIDPGAANPGTNEDSRYGNYSAVATAVDPGSGKVTWTVTVTPDAVASNYQRIQLTGFQTDYNPNGLLRVYKVDNESSRIPTGAAIGVYSDIGCTNLIHTMSTDNNGQADWVTTAGVYYLKEITAPSGYELSTQVYGVKVFPGQTSEYQEGGWYNTINYVNIPKEQNGKLKLKKVSANPSISNGNSCYSLAGAVYGVYTTKSGNTVSGKVGNLTTTASGVSNTVTLETGTYYVKETKAAKGYALNDTVYTVTVTEGNTTFLGENGSVNDMPQHDPLSIILRKRNGDTNIGLAGARFTVRYYDVQMSTDPAKSGHSAERTWVFETDSNGRILFQSATKISGDDFYYVDGVRTMPTGTVTLQETSAPTGFLLNSTVYVVQITSEGSGEIIDTYDDPIIPNTPKKGDVQIEKLDSELSTEGLTGVQGDATLVGVQFAIVNKNSYAVNVGGTNYGKDQEVIRIATVKSGDKYIAKTTGKTLAAGDYTIQEVATSSGYILTDGTARAFTITDDGQVQKLATDGTALSVFNDVIRGGVEVQKVDVETGTTPQGAATLEGAEITITNNSANAVLVEGTLYQPGEVVKTLITDINGHAATANDLLPFGRYKAKEVKAPLGYNQTGNYLEQEFTISEAGVMVSLAHNIENDLIKGDVQIVKYKEDGSLNDIKVPLEGIDFVFTSDTTGQEYRITTDENGYGTTLSLGNPTGGNLPFDTYTMTEENTPSNLAPIAPQKVTIDTQGKTLYFIIRNDAITSPVKVVKKDATTGKVIAAAGAKFQVLDKDKKVISMVATHYPKTVTIDTFETDETGSFVMPELLEVGTYYLRELKAPIGYLLTGEDLKFEITEGHDWEEPITVTFTDAPAMGAVEILKYDKEKNPGDAGYELAGAEFTLTAAEDIKTPDGTVRAKAGTIVDTLVTGKDGRDRSIDVYLGKYILTETKSPNGYKLDTTPITVEVIYGGQDAPVVLKTVEIPNRPDREIQIHTTATNLEGGKYIDAAKDVTIVDTVTLDGLEKGVTYKLSGWEMVRDEGAKLIVDGQEVTGEITFTATDIHMEVQLIFTFDASALSGGKQLVTFEELYDLTNPDEPEKVAAHKDINDEGQMVTIKKKGEIRTITGKNFRSGGTVRTTRNAARTGDVTNAGLYAALASSALLMMLGAAALLNTQRRKCIAIEDTTESVDAKKGKKSKKKNHTFFFLSLIATLLAGSMAAVGSQTVQAAKKITPATTKTYESSYTKSYTFESSDKNKKAVEEFPAAEVYGDQEFARSEVTYKVLKEEPVLKEEIVKKK